MVGIIRIIPLSTAGSGGITADLPIGDIEIITSTINKNIKIDIRNKEK
jgi:hypothetical protein